MVLNYIWIGFIATAFLIACVQLLLGNMEIFPAIINSMFDNAKNGFEISLGLTGVLSLWMGIMKIGERGGLVDTLARWLSPLMVRLFPEIPVDFVVFPAVCEIPDLYVVYGFSPDFYSACFTEYIQAFFQIAWVDVYGSFNRCDMPVFEFYQSHSQILGFYEAVCPVFCYSENFVYFFSEKPSQKVYSVNALI